MPGLENVIEDVAIARIVTRISSEYVLASLRGLVSDLGDIRDVVIVLTIASANTAHLDARTRRGRLPAGVGDPPPDESRKPISIARVAESLGFPFETTRRRVQNLVRSDICVRVGGGVIVPAAILTRHRTTPPIGNVGEVRNFVRNLQAVGLLRDGATRRTPARSARGELGVAQIAAQLSSEYILRALQLLVDAYGDIRTGIVAQAIVTANTAHLDNLKGEGWRYPGLGQVPPDDDRKPIRMSRLALSLNLPYDTLRGQVRRLIETGICARVKGGLIVPSSVLQQPAAVRAMLANVRFVRRFVRDLHAVGVIAGAVEAAGQLQTP
jgi:DNA-binding Lrp family transcriptional regulator